MPPAGSPGRTSRPRVRLAAEWAARWVYDAMMVLLLPLLLPFVALHPRLRGGLAQRLGCPPVPRLSRGARRPVWFQASSAGDLKALLPLLVAARERGAPVVASCWTRSAVALLRATDDPLRLLRAPLDLRWLCGRVLDRVRPRLVVAECLELWPGWLAACSARGIPCVIVNGRLSPRSLRWYRRFAWIFRPRLAELRLVVALTHGDAKRFAAAGVPVDRIRVNSSSKHARCVQTRGRSRPSSHPGAAPEGPRLVLGSVHLAEVVQLVPALEALLRRWPSLLIELAPRYLEDLPRLRRRLRQHGLPYRGRAQRQRGRDDPGARIVLVDAMGVLAQTYAGALAAFVGGSLVPRGGHNLVEPAAQGVPVLHGPYVAHAEAEAALLAEHGASFVVRSGRQLAQTIDALLGDPPRARQAGEAALRVAHELQRGAERVRMLLAPLLDPEC